MELRAARFRDAVQLADRLRFEDAREITASWGLGVREGLMHCLLMSDRSFALHDGAGPEALWGVTAARQADLRIGIPWLLAGERLFDGGRGFLTRSRSMIEHLLVEFDVLANVTDAGNHAHLRWLAWCGFRRLRRHERYGVSARPFVEFYRIGPGCRSGEDAVLAVLRRRPVAGRAPDDALLARLVRLAVPVLEGRRALTGDDTTELARIVAALADPDAVTPRARRGCLRLLVELAQQVTRHVAPPRPGARPPSPGRHTVPRELLASLASLADAVALAPGLEAADVLQAMAPQRAVAPPPRASGTAPAAGERHTEGDAGFSWLLRRYVRRLTLEGRTTRAHGCRCWRASLGVGPHAAAPLDVSPDALWSLLHDRQLADLLARDRGPGADDLGAARRALLASPVQHGAALAAMRDAVPPGSALAEALVAAGDRWAGRPLPTGASARLETVADVLVAAGLLADAAALSVLPGLQLGGVASGYGDRHWLFRLLRARLIGAALGRGAGVDALLVDDVVGLLLAARLERRLLGGEAGSPSAAELQAALREAATLWGGGGAGRAVARHLVRLLVPALAVPVAHVVQLAPALLAWHLARQDRLGEALAAIGDVAGDDGLGSRLQYRNVLRRLCRGIDTLTFAEHLGLEVDAGRRRNREHHTGGS